MVKVEAPCKDCPERQIGCHSKCEKYLSFRAIADENMKERLVGIERLHDLTVIEQKRLLKRKK